MLAWTCVGMKCEKWCFIVLTLNAIAPANTMLDASRLRCVVKQTSRRFAGQWLKILSQELSRTSKLDIGLES
jgi:hypothetical protein